MEQTSLQRQLKLRLDSLAAAGVEFVSTVSSVPFAIEERPQEMAPVSTSLFEDVPVIRPVGVDVARELAVLATEVSSCKKCVELYSTRTQTVFGVGPSQPEICFIGEAPGVDEDRQGEPFVGKAGQLLNRIIKNAGMKREEIYICNVLKCRPPNNRKPQADECRNCRPYLDRQLELLNPKVILCLGGVAANNLLGNTIGVTKLRGTVYKHNGVPLVCTYHPSYLARLEGTADERRSKLECWDDIILMLKQVGREVPKKS